MPVPHGVGEQRVAQIGTAVQVMDVRLAAPEGVVVEHRPEQLPVGLEAIELERAQRARDRRATAASRSSPWAMTLATSES